MCLVYKHMNCHKDHTHIKCAGRTSVARLHDRTPVRYAERTPARRCVFEKPRADRLLGLPLTIFRGMWLVLSNA
jgi:hypothetical protein